MIGIININSETLSLCTILDKFRIGNFHYKLFVISDIIILLQHSLIYLR